MANEEQVSPDGRSNRQQPVSLIMTVRNEAHSLPRLLDSIIAQTRLPDEVVIADGGSTDGTQQIVRAYADRLPLRLVEVPGANISQGRNAAIREAHHSIIAATDAGVVLEHEWLEALAAPLSNEAIDVVAGFFVPEARSTFELAMGATVLPALQDIDPVRFLPSSRSVAFRKSAWQDVEGYPEWLDYCEDLVFDLNLRAAGKRFVFAPGAVAHFRPRSSLRTFFRQYYLYARGDGKADLWRKRHAARYTAYTAGPALAAWSVRHRHSMLGKVVLLASFITGALYCRRPWARLFPKLGPLPLASKVSAVLLVPLIRVTGDLAKMAGYPIGVLWRIRRPRP
ncbi:MAG TPA: glycosyltransferase [Chloroflexia bacterium]|nr:glycosyltransferase [Chloroflexia bacterium]